MYHRKVGDLHQSITDMSKADVDVPSVLDKYVEHVLRLSY